MNIQKNKMKLVTKFVANLSLKLGDTIIVEWHYECSKNK